MCGIAGLINKNKENVEKSMIKQMTDELIHRGPDGEGQYVWNYIGLGHRRLSIIELSDSGSQPMFSHDKKYIIVFNGEIYNYIELKGKLKSLGAVFQSNSDTEVIIEAYRYWGENCVKYFNGMWAFSILDKEKNRIFASRDRMGVKPFCYLDNEKVFCFASEPKAILKVFQEERQVDKTSVYRFFQRGISCMDERTYYQNIKQLLPAHNLFIDLNNFKVSIKRYWKIDSKKAYQKWIKGKNPIKVFKGLFEDAVKVRLRSDAPIGTSLSGGLDSSAIVGVMSKKYNCKVHTFSSVYYDKDCNEKEYIDEVNKYNKTIPHPVFPDKETNRVEAYRDISVHHDGPAGSASLFSGYCVYKEAKKSVKVLIDGQGADELFAGYLPYNERLSDLMEQGGFFNKMKAIRLIAVFKREQPEKMKDISVEVLRWALGKQGSRKYKYEKTQTYMNHRELFREEYISDVDTSFKLGEGKVIGNLNKELYKELCFTSLPDILHNVDSNSMNFSIEIRCPFLDYRLIEFAMALDGDYKIRKQWTKWIMRKALKEYLPDKVLYRTNKMGFPAPFGRWLQEHGEQEQVKSLLDALSERKIFKDGVIQEYYRQHMEGEMDRSFILYRFMSFEMWLSALIDL